MVGKAGAKPWGGYSDVANLLAFCADVDVLLWGQGEKFLISLPIFALR